MSDDKYERSIDELETHACKWWPKEVRDAAQKISILQVLLDTQDKFISILKLIDLSQQESTFRLIEASSITYQLFLKHLIVLTDFGGEPLQRINKDFLDIFPDKKIEYDVGFGHQLYEFKALPTRGTLNNKKMQIDTIGNLTGTTKDINLAKDLIILLLFGAAASTAEARAILFKCGTYGHLGNSEGIDEFIKQNYIRVSRIIGGRTASDMGNVAQQYVVEYLAKELGKNYNVRSNGTIPGVTQNDGITLTTFDVVVDRVNDVSRHKKHVAIEVTFQETSNSTIERKGGQARDRFEKITSSRNYIAYIIDGAGNFARRSAVGTICENSHCNVAYTPEEFMLLVEFIKEKIG